MPIEVLRDEGKGRAFVLFVEGNAFAPFTDTLFEKLTEKSRCLLLRFHDLRDDNWKAMSVEAFQLLSESRVRSASLVGFSDAATLVQNFCLEHPKFVRTAIYVNACSRPHPGKLQRFLDRVERAMPLGLPLRLRSEAFDSKPYLQRLRCPSLVLTTASATEFEKAQAQLFVEHMPTAWRKDLDSKGAEQQLANLVLEFQQVPVKCPQKNISRAA